MNATTVAVDTAKLVFEVAETNGTGCEVKRLRLSRSRFQEAGAHRVGDVALQERL